jgi:omega-amidase
MIVSRNETRQAVPYMRISLLQYAPAWQDRAASRGKIARLLADSALADAALADANLADNARTGESADNTGWLVLPEMCLSGFTMDEKASTWDADDFAFFAGLARELRCHITAGGVERRVNTAFCFSPDGSIASRYGKRQLFSYSAEERSYTAGNAASLYRVGGEGGLRVSQSICYDLRFPYLYWPDAPSVDAYCVIAAWGKARAGHWKALLRARAIENQAFVVAVNRVGEEPDAAYAGDSAVIGPQGEALLDCGAKEGVFSVDIDMAAPAAWRAAFPALKDRRA